MKTFFNLTLVALSLVSSVLAEEAATIPPKIFETPVEASDAFINAAKAG